MRVRGRSDRKQSEPRVDGFARNEIKDKEKHVSCCEASVTNI
jgi:hypothetical protein